MSTRNARSIRSRLVRKLAAYAGVVGVTALGTETSATVMYTDLGPEGSATWFAPFHIDLDLDGRSEFTIYQSAYHCTSTSPSAPTYSGGAGACHDSHFLFADVLASGANAIFPVLDAPLPDGTPILPANGVSKLRLVSALVTDSSSQVISAHGPFAGKRGYLGFVASFADHTKHVGWLDLRGWSPTVVYGFAYEVEDNTPILAGDRGTAPSIIGDTNRDSIVDVNDLNNVRNNFGAAGSPGSTPGDSYPFDAEVNVGDLNAVRNNFGAANSVPEPPSLLLLAAGAAGLALLRRRRAKHEQDGAGAIG